MLNQGKSAGAFDGIRLAAAFAVLFCHCYPLSGHPLDEPFSRLTKSDVTLGECAVYVFFAISGYLVTQSWLRDPSVKRFMMRRLLRIIPALVFVIVSSVALGAVVTTQLLPEYLTSKETWNYLTKIFIYPSQCGLPGVFETNPYPNAVNGSLWTLRLEFAFYIAVAMVGALGLFRWRWVNAFLAASCFAAHIVLSFYFAVAPHDPPQLLLANATSFFIGAALAQTDLHSKWPIGVAIVCALLTGISAATAVFKPLLLVSLPVITIYTARFGHCDLRRVGDLSYGVYLWAFPIQQTIIALQPNISFVRFFFMTCLFTILIAAVSWRLIEKPALELKPRKAS